MTIARLVSYATPHNLLVLTSAAAALAAAIFWLLSARVRLPSTFPIVVTSVHTMHDQLIGAQVVSEGSSNELDNLGRALIHQSQLSAIAALLAAAAAALQLATLVF